MPIGDATRPRYTEVPLPPYSYVPGHAPHPVSDPAGHMHGSHEPLPPALDPDQWAASEAYRLGVDLFNHGFYWEAHEAWEGLWRDPATQQLTSDWLKALIKLAAAAVKAREGNPRGVERHARRAMELVDVVAGQLPGDATHYCGLSIALVEAIARGLVCEASERFTSPQPELLLASWLKLPK